MLRDRGAGALLVEDGAHENQAPCGVPKSQTRSILPILRPARKGLSAEVNVILLTLGT